MHQKALTVNTEIEMFLFICLGISKVQYTHSRSDIKAASHTVEQYEVNLFHRPWGVKIFYVHQLKKLKLHFVSTPASEVGVIYVKVKWVSVKATYCAFLEKGKQTCRVTFDVNVLFEQNW